MALSRPDLQQIIDQIDAEITVQLPGADSRLRNTILGVISRALAGGLHELYGAVDYLARQLFADTAEAEYLERIGDIFGVTRLPATLASGSALAIGTAGTSLPAGLILTRADGLTYTTSAAATIPASGQIDIPILATTSGTIGNANAGTALSTATTIAGLTSIAIDPILNVDTGADLETDDSYRYRIVFRLQNPPHGGNVSDYEAWARDVPGVTAAWCQPRWAGANTVRVLFTWGGQAPSPAQVQLVQNYITAPNRAPVGAVVTCAAPAVQVQNITIQGLSPNTGTMQSAVTAELADLILREGIPGALIPLTHFSQVISNAAGEFDHTILTPSNFVQVPNNAILQLGTVTFL